MEKESQHERRESDDNLLEKAADDEEIVPVTRYSSSEVIIAAEEMKFRQQQAQIKAEKLAAQGEEGKKEALEELRKAYTTLAHQMDKVELQKEYKVNIEQGLSNEEVEARRLQYGLNQLRPPYKMPWWLRLLKTLFTGFFNILLWAGSILCLIAYAVDTTRPRDPNNLYLGIVIALIVLLTGLFSYYQESQTVNLMEQLSKLMPPDVIVSRNGQKEAIQPLYLVPGDIIDLNMGMQIPADIRVIDCSPDMEVDNSSLTGESEPQKRDWRKSEKVPAEAANLTFFGTLLLQGKGTGIVIAIGDNTFMGRTAQLASNTENVMTPIAREIADFIKKISAIAIVLGIIFFAIGFSDTHNVIKNIIFLIGIIVANVPEGLLATVTVCLTLTARRMYHKNVQVKNLESVETLGSTSVICSDKTGTLTTNIMTVQNIQFDVEIRECDTRSPMEALEGNFYSQNKQRYTSFKRLIRCIAICNNAEFLPDGTLDTKANATEAAMVKFAHGHINSEYMLSIKNYRKYHTKLHEIPFNSTNKWQISIHELPYAYAIGDESKIDKEEVQALIVMKGAPEKILELCDRYHYKDEALQLTDEIREKIMKQVITLGSKGERVLGCADLVLDNKKYNLAIPEPANQIFETQYEEEVKDAVYVEYEGKRHRIEVAAVDPANNEPLTFDQHCIGHVMKTVEQILNIPVPNQRILIGDKGVVDPEQTFKELDIRRGCICLLQLGPYKFAGTSRDQANFPLRRHGEQGLIFIGLTSLIDPPRPGVPEAVAKCQSAGIKVIMVTGDHPITAKAIAEKVGIIGPNGVTKDEIAEQRYGGDVSRVQEDEYNAIVVPGPDLQYALDKDVASIAKFWNQVLNKDMVVFARTSPQQKLLIVTAVQERGGIVAVTGDGVNDSPALKKADIGIAMGKTGTEVAKEAADMILLDDNFASIVNGIEQGRIVFDNLKKSIAYTLASNIPELIPFLVYQILGIPLPLTVVMILLVDVGTDLAPAVSFAYEDKESDIMRRSPRNPDVDNLVTWRLISFSYLQIGMLQGVAGFFAYFVVLHSFGLRPTFLLGVDYDNIFAYSANPAIQRNAYYLYCFDTSYSKRNCFYFPDFSNTLTESGYNDWLSGKDSYLKYSRELIERKFGVQMESLSFADAKTFWEDTVIPEFNQHIYTTPHYPTRMCWQTDYYDNLIPYCNLDGRTSPGVNSLFPMSMKDRDEALTRAQSANFVSIVIVQWADLMCCKGRTRSLLEKGMHNHFMNYALLCETLLAGFLVYTPIANTICGTRPLRFVWWTAAIPFMVLIYIYDEVRKGWIRKNRYGWLERNTYW